MYHKRKKNRLKITERRKQSIQIALGFRLILI